MKNLAQTFLVAVALCFPALAASKVTPLSDQVISAKSIYLVNQTGNQAVLDTANDEFTKWGRFKMAKAKDDADLIVVFSHNNGLDKWGNVGVTKMEVFVKGNNEAAFAATSALKLITVSQRPTKACVADLRKRLEPKN